MAKTRARTTRTATAAAAQATPRRTVRLLLVCVGRRVELIRAFRRAGDALGLQLELHGSDADPLAPGLFAIDRQHLVPRIDNPDYIPTLLDIVERERIDGFVPLIDLDLAALSASADAFAQRGCCPVISSPEVIRIAQDKLATYEFLQAAGIDAPRTWPWDALCARKRHRFPYYMKPRTGSAGQGNYVIHNRDELVTLGQRVNNAIVQELVPGTEYTMDVYTGLDGRPRVAVPRQRIEVRSGEVSKGLVVKDPDIMAVGLRVATALNEAGLQATSGACGCRGVVTVQVMRTADGRIRVIEINPRLGGGAPLAIHAGADFPKWLLQELLGEKPRIGKTSFTNDLLMLRHDDSIFVARGSKLLKGR